MDASGESGSEEPWERSSHGNPTSDPHSNPPQDNILDQTPTPPTTPQPPSPSEETPGISAGRVSLSSTSTISPKNISIKAYLTEDTIIVFRVPVETKYAEIRDKVYDKFVNQEGIPLRLNYPLTYLTPARRRSTSSSVYSGIKRACPGSIGSASAQESSLIQIQSQEGWEEIVRESDGKLTLRVFE